MIGYMIYDTDNNLGYRTQQFIEQDDLLFVSNNRHFIQKMWKFDTENRESIKTVLRYLSDLKVKEAAVLAFFSSIGVDLKELMKKKDVLS